jgi:dCTP deaminase
MLIKLDRWIVEQSENGMIRPFSREQVKKIDLPQGTTRKVISYGVSSYGYDMRLSNMFRVMRMEEGMENKEIDPKNVRAGLFQPVRADDYLVIPPHGLVLGQTVEYFKIPRDILTICYGKSTYARCGVFINVTPFEPEWEGYATLAISNMSPAPVRLYAGEGIAQLLFLQSDEVCNVSYRDKDGKYQAQKEITTAIV